MKEEFFQTFEGEIKDSTKYAISGSHLQGDDFERLVAKIQVLEPILKKAVQISKMGLHSYQSNSKVLFLESISQLNTVLFILHGIKFEYEKEKESGVNWEIVRLLDKVCNLMDAKLKFLKYFK